MCEAPRASSETVQLELCVLLPSQATELILMYIYINYIEHLGEAPPKSLIPTVQQIIYDTDSQTLRLLLVCCWLSLGNVTHITPQFLSFKKQQQQLGKDCE